MYLRYYGLAKPPFGVTPDPGFLFLSISHKEALASLLYGIEYRRGFIAITGDVGSGKTTILRALLRKINPERVVVAYLFNPEVSFEEFLRTIFLELGIPLPRVSLNQAVRHFHQYLINQYQNDRHVVLIVDEAHRIPPQTLERLRVLSNLETAEHKLLQIVLCGQPELDQMLARYDLRQLRERIAVRASIRNLNRAETSEYIQYRMRKAANAGHDRAGVFTDAALRLIWRYTKGNPRLINIVCDNVLIAGYANDEKAISASTVAEAIPDLRLARGVLWARPLAVRVAGAAIILAIIFFSALFWATSVSRGKAAADAGESGDTRAESTTEETERAQQDSVGPAVVVSGPSTPETQYRAKLGLPKSVFIAESVELRVCENEIAKASLSPYIESDAEGETDG